MQIAEWDNGNGYNIKLSPEEAKEILSHLYRLETRFSIIDDYKEYEFEVKAEAY